MAGLERVRLVPSRLRVQSPIIDSTGRTCGHQPVVNGKRAECGEDGHYERRDKVCWF